MNTVWNMGGEGVCRCDKPLFTRLLVYIYRRVIADGEGDEYSHSIAVLPALFRR